MGPYVFVTMLSYKSGSVTVRYCHNERVWDQYESNSNIDTSRTYLNYNTIKPEGPYLDVIRKRIKEYNVTPRQNSSYMVEALVAPSPEWINSKSAEEQREFFEYVTDFFREWLGDKRMLSGAVHMDETSPHMHIAFTPITDDGRLSKTRVIGKKKYALSEFQDRFYRHVAKKYPEINRGIPRGVSHRKHLPVYLYKSAAELMEHYEELLVTVQDINVFNSKEKKDQTMRLLSKYTEDYASIMYRIKTAETYLGQAEEEAKRKDRRIERLEEDVNGKKLEISRLKEDRKELTEERDRLRDILSAIQPDIRERTDEKMRKERNTEI